MPVVRRALAGLLGILASLAGMVAVSSATGGPLTWVVTEGNSMLPSITPGTLAVLQRHPSYSVGDVVGYRNADLASQVVLHRVVEVEGTKLRLQGDNNGWVDPYRPTVDEVIGEQLFAVPAVGKALDAVREPVPIAVLGGAVTLLLLRSRSSGRRRTSTAARRRPSPAPTPRPQRPSAHPTAQPTAALSSLPRPPSPPSPPGPSSRSWAQPVLPRLAVDVAPLVLPAACRDVAVVGLAACALTLGATALLPTAQTTRADQPVQASVHFDYVARATPGLVYADGEAGTGEPLFLDVVDDVVVGADLDVVAPAGAVVTGTWRLVVEVADSTGWTTTAYVGQPTDLDDPRREVRLRPADLLDLARRAAELTGLEPTTRSLTVRALVEATASRGEVSVPLEAEPELGLALEPKVVRLLPDAPLSGGADAALPAPPAPLGDRVRLGPVELPTGPTRAIALVLGGGFLLLLVAVSAAVPWRDELSSLRRRYPGLLVPTGPLHLEGPVVEVDDVAALARIAQRYERFVMVSEDAGHRVFVVQDDGTTYRYSAGTAAPSASSIPAPRRAADDEVRT